MNNIFDTILGVAGGILSVIGSIGCMTVAVIIGVLGSCFVCSILMLATTGATP